MEFTSTRAIKDFKSAQAITNGISQEGGLFVPTSFPSLSKDLLAKMVDMDYKQRAVDKRQLLLLFCFFIYFQNSKNKPFNLSQKRT